MAAASLGLSLGASTNTRPGAPLSLTAPSAPNSSGEEFSQKIVPPGRLTSVLPSSLSV